MLKIPIYFPGLRPPGYFDVGKTLYIYDVRGLRECVVTKLGEVAFHFKTKGSDGEQVESCNSSGIFSVEEMMCLHQFFLTSVEILKEAKNCSGPTEVYACLAAEAKNGADYAIHLMYVLDRLVPHGADRHADHIIHFIKHITAFKFEPVTA